MKKVPNNHEDHPDNEARRHICSSPQNVSPIERKVNPSFGFFRSSDGCIDGLRHWHRKYLRGELPSDVCDKLDCHLLYCRRCLNTWEALTSELEESWARHAARKRPRDASSRQHARDHEDETGFVQAAESTEADTTTLAVGLGKKTGGFSAHSCRPSP